MQYFREINTLSITIRILMAMSMGGVLGLERGRKNRPAGFRTYMLVCLGSALVMMTNQYIYQVFRLSDPSRMGAQVVSGIGFLGAGSIIITGKNQVKGITTAAGLWGAACLGLAIGIGFYEGAIIGGVCILLVMSALGKIDEYIFHHSKVINIYYELSPGCSTSEFLAFARTQQFEVQDIQVSKNLALEGSAHATLKSVPKRTHVEMLETLSGAPCIHYLEEIKD